MRRPSVCPWPCWMSVRPSYRLIVCSLTIIGKCLIFNWMFKAVLWKQVTWTAFFSRFFWVNWLLYLQQTCSVSGANWEFKAFKQLIFFCLYRRSAKLVLHKQGLSLSCIAQINKTRPLSGVSFQFRLLWKTLHLHWSCLNIFWNSFFSNLSKGNRWRLYEF